MLIVQPRELSRRGRPRQIEHIAKDLDSAEGPCDIPLMIGLNGSIQFGAHLDGMPVAT